MIKYTLMFNIGNVQVNSSVTLAPMAGITDLPYRLICKEMGASLVVTELVSAKGILYKNPNNKVIMETSEDEAPAALQIFGSDPFIMSAMANRATDEYPYKIVDINMGCPVPKVVNNGEGSALLKDIELAKRIIETMVRVLEAKKIPVTVKMRIGFDKKHINGVEFAKMCEDAGASAITVHARCRDEYYLNEALHLDVLKEIAHSVKIPVIGSGNIFTIEDAKNMIENIGCTGVALARGVCGNPWFVRECREYLENNKKIDRPKSSEIKDMIFKHLELMSKYKSIHVTVQEMRKHIAWYTKSLPGSTKFRQKLNDITDIEYLKEYINSYFENL